jgi:hypothetical protein
MKAERAEALKTALSEGKLTQAQYDYIVAAQAKIDALMGSASSPKEQSDETKVALKTEFDALRDWMKAQNLSPRDLGVGFGRGGHGGHGPDRDADDTVTNE